jgi:hypothetical protein
MSQAVPDLCVILVGMEYLPEFSLVPGDDLFAVCDILDEHGSPPV